MLYGTAPHMAQGDIHDPDAAVYLRYGSGPTRDAQHARGDLLQTDYTPYRFYNLEACPLPQVEAHRRGGASTRADYRNSCA
jgi:hypothetical protein